MNTFLVNDVIEFNNWHYILFYEFQHCEQMFQRNTRYLFTVINLYKKWWDGRLCQKNENAKLHGFWHEQEEKIVSVWFVVVKVTAPQRQKKIGIHVGMTGLALNGWIYPYMKSVRLEFGLVCLRNGQTLNRRYFMQ